MNSVNLIEDKIKEKLGKKILEWKQSSPRRVYFSLKKEDILETAKVLFKELGLRFVIATGTDTPEGLEILYHFSLDKTGVIYSVRVLIEDKKSPKIDSIAPLFPGAEWIEREIWELLGINFVGHPNLTHLLLIDDWPQGKYPLRKDKC
ncbi:MAG: NADH-quinone oxidoreductase subunit C [Candidatus Omnitrophica bacterium]|nr:NADH-quinone oxidoreductase subunit C [Candidatus Omnitrophota bacterium]MBL7151220.1 NADH-quinone oxidoreductase subunit C [Candidatus Omnitrophota bacterium]MBL7210465.1 NADH-quinone oxidoreductase subunit C [Candidatus Omnitrophota bacterium]